MSQNGDNLELEIVLALIREDLHLRAIARAVGAPAMSVQRRLARLMDANVLDCEAEGRNKVFRLKRNLQAKNYIFNAERYKLMKLINEYPEVGMVVEGLIEKTDRPVLLFGSYARFEAKKDSDIDIYVDTDERKVKAEMEIINSKVRVKIGAFDRDSNLIKEIVKNHVVLKGVEAYYEKTGFFA